MIEVPDDRENLPSASSLERIVHCPGSFLAEKAYPNKSNPSAKRGTKVHEYLEGKRDFNSLNFSEQILADRIAFKEGQLVNKYSLEACENIREKRLWYFDSTFEKVFSAKPDVIKINKGNCLVINYKSGHYLPTPIDSNMQVAAEVLTVYQNIKVDRIVGCLIHPNVEPQVQLKRFRKAELEQLGTLLEKQAKEALKADSERMAGEHCVWCRAKKDCKTHSEWSKNQ